MRRLKRILQRRRLWLYRQVEYHEDAERLRAEAMARPVECERVGKPSWYALHKDGVWEYDHS